MSRRPLSSVHAIRRAIVKDILMYLTRLPLSLRGAQTVLDGRRQVEAIIKGDDDRLLVIVGSAPYPRQS
jgi:3-deoxy-7-phosphoheptulonate synthase